MSTFYLLPPRPFVTDHLAGYLAAWFPGLDGTRAAARELADALAETAGSRGVHVLHREDLPDGEDTVRALVNGFGAEPGDEVIEVRAGARPGELAARRWRLGAGDAA